MSEYELTKRIIVLESSLKESEASCTVLREALKAVRTMWQSKKPKKLDEALSWRENDEKAESMANHALTDRAGKDLLDEKARMEGALKHVYPWISTGMNDCENKADYMAVFNKMLEIVLPALNPVPKTQE